VLLFIVVCIYKQIKRIMKESIVIEKVLDQDLKKELQECLTEEAIIWEGNPSPNFSITWLESDGTFDAGLGFSNIFAIVLGAIVSLSAVSYNYGSWIGLILTSLIGIAILLAPEIANYKRKRNTKYAFTKNGVFFYLWHWKEKSTHFVDFLDIDRITYEEDADKNGVVYFLPKKAFDFHTRNLDSGSKRMYLTFEAIPNVVDLKKRLEELRRARVKEVN